MKLTLNVKVFIIEKFYYFRICMVFGIEACDSAKGKNLLSAIHEFDERTKLTSQSPACQVINQHVPYSAESIDESMNDYSFILGSGHTDIIPTPILNLSRTDQQRWHDDAKLYWVSRGTKWDDAINAKYPEEMGDIYGGYTDCPSKCAYVAGRLLGIALIQWWVSEGSLEAFVNEVADLKALISYVAIVKRGILKELDISKEMTKHDLCDQGITTLTSVILSAFHKQDYRIFNESATRVTDLSTAEASYYPDILHKVNEAYSELDKYRFYNLIGPTGKNDKAGAGVHHFVPNCVAAIIERIMLLNVNFNTSGYMDLGCGFGYLLNAFRKIVKGRVWGVDLENVSSTLTNQIRVIRQNNTSFFNGIAVRTADLTNPTSYILPDDINIVSAFVGKLVNDGVVEKIALSPHVEILCIMGHSYDHAIRLGHLGFAHVRQFTCTFARNNSGAGKTIDIYHRTYDESVKLTQRKV